jgi:ComF family protein
VLFASSCPVCGLAGPAPCASCRRALVPIGQVVDVPAGLDACVAGFAFEGVGRDLVTALKYRNRRETLPWLGLVLARQVEHAVGPLPAEAVIVPVPTSRRRRRARGFDQADLLAGALARHLGRPRRRLLVRYPGRPQTGRSRSERLHGPVLGARHPCGAPVVLVDDVLTSGATLAAAAQVVRAAGAPSVVGAVLSVTPFEAQGEARHGRQSGVRDTRAP